MRWREPWPQINRWGIVNPASRPPGQEIEACPAEHLTLQHLQAIDLAFDRALAPGQRDRCLDGSDVRPEPSGETPEGREAARGGAYQPWCKVCGLALADEGGEVLRERYGLRQFRPLCGQLRELVVILVRGPFRRAKDKPGGPTRGERPSWTPPSPRAAGEGCTVVRGLSLGLGADAGHTGPPCRTGPETPGGGSSGSDGRHSDTRGSTRPGEPLCTDRGGCSRGHASAGARETPSSGGTAAPCAD